MTETIPGRASDSGPDTPTETLPWWEYLENAEDALCHARRTSRTNLEAENKLRLEAIECAEEWIQAAKAALPPVPAEAAKLLDRWLGE